MAKSLGLRFPLTAVQRDLLKDLHAFRLTVQTGATEHERSQARVRYGRTIDRLVSRAVKGHARYR